MIKYDNVPIIEMDKLTDYVPLEKQLFLDAEKYSKRAIEYLAEGKLSHAAGCMAKACKKLNKAEQFKRSMETPFPLFIHEVSSLLADRIAKNILK